MFRIIAGVRNHPEGKSGSYHELGLTHPAFPAGLKGFIPLFPSFRPLLADLKGFIPLFPSSRLLLVGLKGFIPLFPSFRLLLAGLKGFIPLFSSFRPLPAHLKGLIPLFPSSRPLPAGAKGLSLANKNTALQQTSVRDGILSKGSLKLAPTAYFMLR
ncbi:hypothetical protein [Paenibacillus sp. FSL R10-2736]|uniref:hypothetical protein n=1 Tax=Paenibacillus sp. FSL R10-2736 TaxID=2954692 RepID=UPI0030F995FF